jgi:hypothetical protein
MKPSNPMASHVELHWISEQARTYCFACHKVQLETSGLGDWCDEATAQKEGD